MKLATYGYALTDKHFRFEQYYTYAGILLPNKEDVVCAVAMIFHMVGLESSYLFNYNPKKATLYSHGVLLDYWTLIESPRSGEIKKYTLSNKEIGMLDRVKAVLDLPLELLVTHNEWIFLLSRICFLRILGYSYGDILDDADLYKGFSVAVMTQREHAVSRLQQSKVI